MDISDEAKRTLYRINIVKDNFIWTPTPSPNETTTAYSGSLGPVQVVVIRYKIDGVEMLGIPHGGYGYDGVVRTGMNVIHMPQDMAEAFYKQAEKQLSSA